MSWLIFGLPSLLAVWVASFLAKRFLIERLDVLKRVRFWMVAFSLPVAGLIFGASMGWLAAWSYRHDFELRGNQSWVDIVALPGAPGDAMANVYGGDWQDDEAWDYRGDIMILNAVFWASVAGAGAGVIWFVFRRGKRVEMGREHEVGFDARPQLFPLPPGKELG